MEQKIRYKGLSLTPDELAQENGTMELCGNAELHDGALRPSVIRGTDLAHDLKVTKTINGTAVTKVCKLLYVHKRPTYTNYIGICEPFSDSGHISLHWFDGGGVHGGQEGDASGEIDIDYTLFLADDTEDTEGANIIQVESIGNTLIILATNGTHYVLWKDTTYKYLGQRPPFVKIGFCMGNTVPSDYDKSTIEISGSNHLTAYRAFPITINSSTYEYNGSTSTGTIKTNSEMHDITENIWALINQTHDHITKEGHFYTNFMVRYCYRLYDGTMIMHSAPILMPVGIPNPVQVMPYNFSADGTYSSNVIIDTYYGGATVSDKMVLCYTPVNAALRWAIMETANMQTLKSDWSDIVLSLDIFVSPQFMKVSDTEPIKTFSSATGKHSIGICQVNSDPAVGYVPLRNSNDAPNSAFLFDLPEMSDGEYYKKMRDNSVFYKVKSLLLENIDAADDSYNGLDLSDVLPTLTSQEAMADDYKTHNMLLPMADSSGNVLTRLYTYNSRLNISSVTEKLFEGFSVLGGLTPPCQTFVTLSNGYWNVPSGAASTNIYVDSIVFTINTEEGVRYVKINVGANVTKFCLCNCLYFYPDTRATKVTVNCGSGSGAYSRTMLLEPCLNLNGAMVRDFTTFGKSDNFPATDTQHYAPTINRHVQAPNKIYTSAVNNPFHFPPESIYSVGTGTILGMAATTRAISQGQFGQYPLMAFTTDGIWALNVSNTGAFSAVHPISREVCVNPASICQLDQQVVFANSKGLAVLTEQNVTPITSVLDGAYKDIASIAPGLAQYFIDTTGDTQTIRERNADIRSLIGFDTSPIDFLKGGAVFFDSTSGRLLVYGSPSGTRQPIYVYTIGDGTWSTMVTKPILTAVNGYPYGYIQHTDGSVTCLDKPYPYADTDAIPTLIVTRALSFGDGVFSLANIAHSQMMAKRTTLFVFGSNDLVNWHYVGRTNQRHVYYLPSRAYRYYRFALYNVMKPGEQYISTSFDVILKFPKL